MAKNGLFPVSIDRHRNRYWRRFTSFEFARNIATPTLVMAEIVPAAAAFPIAFRHHETGILPVAVLSLGPEDDTPFVSASGSWLANYVPSALRCFPFLTEPKPNRQDSSRLFVDEASGLVTTCEKDQPFFTRDDQLTPDLNEILAFFQNRQASLSATLDLCEQLEKLGLFVPLDQLVSQRVSDQLFGLDSEKLRQLPCEQVSILFRSEAMRLAHAHEISLSHLGWLARAQQLASLPPKAESCRSELTGFLSALAEDTTRVQTNWEGAYAI